MADQPFDPSDDGDSVLTCSLCGVALRRPGPWGAQQQWLAQAELLSDPDDEFEAREQHYRAGKRPGVVPFVLPDGPPAEIRRDAAVMLTPTRCVVLADSRELRPNWGAKFDEDHVPVGIPYSIAVHAACVALTARVVRRPRAGIRLRSMRTLWKVLRTRFDAHDNELMGSVDVPGSSNVVLDNNFYLPTWTASLTSLRELPGLLFASSDPLNVPDLTSKLLTNLEPMDGRPPSGFEGAFQTRFQHLPPELREKVVSFMMGPEGLPAACTRLLHPSAWRDILLEPDFLPFLWDLDAGLARAYDDEKRSQGLVLDWETLVRKLSTKLSLGRGCYADMDVANGLRNRRRIWQLAEEMYVGDQLPRARFLYDSQPPPSMPRYWDEDGEPLHPVVRIQGK